MSNPANEPTLSALVATVNLDERFWPKVHKTDTCWLWTSFVEGGGYGAFRIGRRNQKAHRVAYVDRFGDIPEGLVLDHLCRVRHCVNPDHLEAVTHRVNVLRGTLPSAVAHMAGRCQNGHEVNEANTSFKIVNGKRQVSGCRICRNIKARAERAALVEVKKRFRQVAESRGMKVKQATVEALTEWIERYG